MDYILDLFRKNRCIYCRQDLSVDCWNSEWGERDEHHYKSLQCPCGKKNWLKVDFPGSGHDTVLKKEFSPLESAVKKVQER